MEPAIRWTALGCALFALAACGDNDGRQVIRTVSAFGRTPIAGVAVQVGDQDWVTTDENGEASFTSSATPFSVRVHQITRRPDEGMEDIFEDVWELTERTENPLVVGVGPAAGAEQHVDLSGKVTGQRGGAAARVIVFARTGVYGATSTTAGADGTYSLSVSWEGSGSRTIDVGAIELDSNFPPARYHGYTSVAVPVIGSPEGGTPAQVQLALQPVQESRVTGTVSLAPGFSGEVHPSVALEFPDGSSVALSGSGTGSTGSYSFATPLIEGAFARIGFTGDAPESQLTRSTTYRYKKVSPPASNVDFALPLPTKLSEPAEGAEVTSSTVFRWAAVPTPGRYAMSMICAPTTGTQLRLVAYHLIETAKPQARLPAIPDLDVRGLRCTWQVGWLDASAFDLFATGGIGGDDYQYAWSSVRTVTPR